MLQLARIDVNRFLLCIYANKMLRSGKRTMVARKNIRDLRGSVINPRDHFVLPSKQLLSRNDVSELLSNQGLWSDNPRMRALIPQLLGYMVSLYKGTPTVAKAEKVRGGAPGLEAFASNPAVAARLANQYAQRTIPTHLPPQRGSTANTPPWLRNRVVHERQANNTNMGAASPHTPTTPMTQRYLSISPGPSE